MSDKSKDEIGDRMKSYEQMEAGRKTMPRLPIMVRLDGKGFSKWTSGLNRPYDKRLSELMIQTTEYLVEESVADLGYTQSDEISLAFLPKKDAEFFFNGKIQKLTSVLASMATAFFNSKVAEMIPEKANKLAFFDCRVWNVPDIYEATNTFVWRELDATKNSISMAAREYYSDKELFKITGKEKQEMLFQKGINWNDYPVHFKRGTYVRRETYLLDDGITIRSRIIKPEIEPISKLPNKIEILFPNFGESNV